MLWCASVCHAITVGANLKGREVVVSDKLRAARPNSMKFTNGFMTHPGQPARDFIDNAVRHVLLHQGVLEIKVKPVGVHTTTACIEDW